MADETVVALIPLRGGSRSIPRKNIRGLAGRPLCDWAIRSALDSGVFSAVWVSTDDEEIAGAAAKSGARVHWRAPQTATDKASSETALVEFLSVHPEVQVLALVQATSPLTHPEHFQEAWKRFLAERADSLVTVTREHRFRWSGEGKPLNYDPAERPRRQDWKGELVENGAFYFTRRALLESPRPCRLGGKTVVYEMPSWTAFEADQEEDWIILESLVRRYGHSPKGSAIRLLAIDADGVLTDAGFYYDENGEVMKKYNTRDGAGLKLLMDAGIEVGIITGEATGFVPARARKIGIGRLELGCSDKLPVLDAWRRELGLEWDEVAYMGDDLADMACIRTAGIGACPCDAEPQVCAVSDYVSPVRGGQGAVRDFIRYLSLTKRVSL